MTNVAQVRRHVVGLIGAAVVLCLGLTACSGADKADATPDSSHSAKAEVDPQDEKAAREALVSADLKTLSDHKAKTEKPEYVVEKLVPFRDCTGEGPDSLKAVGQVSQEFKGDPKLKARGFVIDGDVDEVFAELREIWLADECQSHKIDGDSGTVNFMHTQDIDRPTGVGEESWFGACYSGFGANSLETGKCVVLYPVGDNGIAEISSSHDSKSNKRIGDFLHRVGVEALRG